MVSGKQSKALRRAAAARKAAGHITLPAPGDPISLVKQRHLRYATDLVAAGVVFPQPPAAAVDQEAALELVRAHIKEPSTGDHDFTLIAHDSDLEVIGALICQGFAFDNDFLAEIRFLVTRPDWRGRGVGYVLMGLVPQLVEALAGQVRSTRTIGNCAPEQAGFYQRLGFRVEAPGHLLDLTRYTGAMGALPDDTDQPCWFHRDY